MERTETLNPHRLSICQSIPNTFPKVSILESSGVSLNNYYSPFLEMTQPDTALCSDGKALVLLLVPAMPDRPSLGTS